LGFFPVLCSASATRRRRTRLSSSSCRIGCRRRIRCRRRSKPGPTISRRNRTAPSLTRSIRHSSSVRRSIITTWRDGIADFAYVNPGYQPGRFPIIAAGELPFLVGRAKGGNLAIDSWYRKYAAAEMKDVHYCFAFVLDPLAWHSTTKKIVVPSDIQGMKIRPAQATIGAWVTQLGGTNVQASAPEVRDVLAKGVADAVTFPWGSLVLFGIDKVTKYDMDEPLGSVMFVWVMNKWTYAAMSPAQQKVIDAHCTSQWAAKFADPWADFEHAGIAKVKAEPDHEVYTISADQLAAWKKSAEPLKQKWADGVKGAGGDPDTIFKELQASLAQYNAGF
jgi:TRAP-type C4-dicarboxylate transport system substrate-binding protein